MEGRTSTREEEGGLRWVVGGKGESREPAVISHETTAHSAQL